MRKNIFLVVLLPIIFLVNICVDDSWADGFGLWEELSEESKIIYIIAYVDGFTTHVYLMQGQGVFDDESVKYFTDKFVYKDASELRQIVDGLNKFYDDYANQKILVSIAYAIVVLRIRGTPEDEVQKHIENMRRVSDRILSK